MNRSAGRRRPRSAVASANVGIDLKIKIIFDHDWLLFCCFDHRTRLFFRSPIVQRRRGPVSTLT